MKSTEKCAFGTLTAAVVHGALALTFIILHFAGVAFMSMITLCKYLLLICTNCTLLTMKLFEIRQMDLQNAAKQEESFERGLPPRAPILQAMYDAVAEEGFDALCCGPAVIMGVERDGETVRLQLKSRDFRPAQTYYTGCVYAQIDQNAVGVRIVSIIPATVELLKGTHAADYLAEALGSYDRAPEQLKAWEADGLKLCLHYGERKDQEYLVVCREMRCRDEYTG